MIGKAAHILQNLLPLHDPEKMKNLFVFFQFAMGALLLFVVFRLSERGTESGFKLREADRLKNQRKRSGLRRGPDLLAEAKMTRRDPATVLQLDGIRTDVPPHELLGVSLNASVDDIQRAYRALIKRYHPDRVGPSGSREWKDAQRIAEAINLAKETLLKQAKSRARVN